MHAILTLYLPYVLHAELKSYPLKLNNGLALTPQMGWNSWNHYACGITEDIMKSTMDALVSTGLAKAGYIYANVDDCWAGNRNTEGNVVPDTKSFPNGMASLADYAHSQGLRFGLYSDAGRLTCAGRPGSLGYETNDAQSYASWKVDYLKYDNCYSTTEPMQDRYHAMRDALNSTGRPIFFSMCSWGGDEVDYWGNTTGNSWRTTGDIRDSWTSMLSNWDHNGPAASAGPGGWNDPDMLEVGNGGMSTTEYITHFSLWCIGKAPLLIGCDITSMTNDTKMILMNEEAIAVNQDKLGVQCTEKWTGNDGEYNVYSAPLINDEVAVVLLNRMETSGNISVSWQQLGLEPTQKYVVRDLWKHKNVGTMDKGYGTTVEGHGAVFVKLSPTK
eukprot:413728_1